MTDFEKLKLIFVKNQKCIVNTDLDGILSGILLQKFLNWEIVGFSSCAGKPDDEIWLKDDKIKIHECVFVDLPVAIKSITIIDQHFVAVDRHHLERYNNCDNKINPNIMRERLFVNDNGYCEYTQKYPFGTVHFILACLENLKIIPSDYKIDFYKKIENFDVCDLLFRADCVIGNTNNYTRNCLDWCNWLIKLGGQLTNSLFNIVKTEYNKRSYNEKLVEQKLKNLGCLRADGDCSNMLRNKNYVLLKQYFDFLANSLNMPTLPIFNLFNFSKLSGCRFDVSGTALERNRKQLYLPNTFSYAFVTMKTLSMTFINKGENNE